MNFEELIKKRRTIYEFSNKKILAVDLKKILNAARLSPSCLNNQPWEFILVRNKETISKLMDTAVYGTFHSDPIAIIVPVLIRELYCTEEQTKSECEKSRIGGLMSLSMACMNITLQAEDLGIGNSIIGSKYGATNNILKIVLTSDIPFFIALGYEKENAFKEINKRKKFKEVVVYHS